MGPHVITLPVHLDRQTSPELQRLLGDHDAGGSAIELDGSAIERVDGAGLQVLASFALGARAEGTEVRWTGASAVLREACRLTGLTRHLALEREDES